jgi:hypothetical protein
MLDFESGLSTPQHRARPYPFRARVLRPYRSEHDPELGFLPLLAAAIPMVTSLAGSLMSKSSKKTGGPPPEAAQARDIAALLTKVIGQDSKTGQPLNLQEVVRKIVSTVPSPVIGQVKRALAEIKADRSNGILKRDVIVNAVDNKLGPKVGALLAGLKASTLQKQATYEHRKLRAKAEFRRDVKHDLSRIAQRLDAMDARLNRAAIVQGQTRIDLLGGRNLLER